MGVPVGLSVVWWLLGSGRALGGQLDLGRLQIPGFGWALGGRLGSGILAGLWAVSDYRVGWVSGLPEDFGLAVGFWALCVIDGRMIWWVSLCSF